MTEKNRITRSDIPSATPPWPTQQGITHNIILFGEAGAGKSSVVNMIVGRDVAKVNNGAQGCTFRNEAYEAKLFNREFAVYDTAGLNEGEKGRVPHWQAVRELYTLIRRLDSVSLLIYCMRGRVKENAMANWVLFNKVICEQKVPTIAVVTGLEDLDDPDEWWRTKDNKDTLRKNHIEPKDVACVVAFRGRRNEHAKAYFESQKRLTDVLKTHYLRKPWSKNSKEEWFTSIYQEAFFTTLCIRRKGLDYTHQMRMTITEFIKETCMEEDDSEKLMATLLRAEQKFRKRRFG